jgi:hypothetical protein
MTERPCFVKHAEKEKGEGHTKAIIENTFLDVFYFH